MTILLVRTPTDASTSARILATDMTQRLILSFQEDVHRAERLIPFQLYYLLPIEAQADAFARGVRG
ncbi:Uncharacterised protein [Sphingobacterium spiritivorum]|uniref:Uncharacterized protein n=1 Tax=Sphingobacterium spiritivorum TaxID=258 RepID=A0A380CQP3_SPHSI|nr:Uncharacterised protein [Sphingobacterium spiritivorum]